MDGAYPQRVAGRVDQQDQAEVPGAGDRVFLLETEVRGPAVVAVGDERLVSGEIGFDLGPVGRVGDRPEAVAVAVLRGGGEQWRPVDGAFDDGGRAGRVTLAAVGQQERFEVGGCGPHQVGPVFDDMGHHVLVRQHDAVRGGGERQCPDDAALQGFAVALFVDIERGLRLGGEYALVEPAVQGLGGLLVARGGRVGLRQYQPDDVVRVRGFQVVQPVGAHDDVVRR